MSELLIMPSLSEVSAGFRSLVERRRRHLSFLFSTIAAFSILADGLLRGRQPEALALDGSGLLVAGATALMLLSIVTALREARLHKGLVYNGDLFLALTAMAPITVGHGRPWRFNPFGVSTTLFAMATLSGIALMAFNAAVLGVPHQLTLGVVVVTGALLVSYFRVQHRAGSVLAATKTTAGVISAVTSQAWRDHVVASVDDAHRDMLELLSLAGLVAFSGFTLLAGLGDARASLFENLPFNQIQSAGPIWLSLYLIVTTTLALVSYVRLRFAVGYFSRALDRTDKPFRALSVDDSFFGLLILVALLSFDVVLLVAAVVPQWSMSYRAALATAVAVLIVAAERIAMEVVGRRLTRAAGGADG